MHTILIFSILLLQEVNAFGNQSPLCLQDMTWQREQKAIAKINEERATSQTAGSYSAVWPGQLSYLLHGNGRGKLDGDHFQTYADESVRDKRFVSHSWSEIWLQFRVCWRKVLIIIDHQIFGDKRKSESRERDEEWENKSAGLVWLRSTRSSSSTGDWISELSERVEPIESDESEKERVR